MNVTVVYRSVFTWIGSIFSFEEKLSTKYITGLIPQERDNLSTFAKKSNLAACQVEFALTQSEKRQSVCKNATHLYKYQIYSNFVLGYLYEYQICSKFVLKYLYEY